MIEVHDLVKRYGGKTAVNGLTFTVQPGVVTGFLGPNGAGKSTTMRLIVGLDRPTAGRVSVNGKSYDQWAAPLAEVGVLLEAKAIHPGLSAYQYLHALAATHGIGTRRVREVLDMTGLASVADKRAGGFSLGMGQRLGIAAALMADPEALILDEPVNGLDIEGVRWVRHLLKDLAREGRTVLRLQPPDERDGADRRSSDRDRPRRADRRYLGDRVHPACHGQQCAGPHSGGAPAAGPHRWTRRNGKQR